MSNEHRWVGRGLKREESNNWYYISSNWRLENNNIVDTPNTLKRRLNYN